MSTSTKDPGKAKTLLEAARKLGITYKTAKRLREDGWATDSSGKLDVAEGQRLMTARAARAPGGLETGSKAVFWKERRLKAQALREEIELAEHRKKLISIADARRAWGIQATKVKNAFKGMGRQLAPPLLHRGMQEIQAIIDRRVLEILNDLSHADYGPES